MVFLACAPGHMHLTSSADLAGLLAILSRLNPSRRAPVRSSRSNDAADTPVQVGACAFAKYGLETHVTERPAALAWHCASGGGALPGARPGLTSTGQVAV